MVKYILANNANQLRMESTIEPLLPFKVISDRSVWNVPGNCSERKDGKFPIQFCLLILHFCLFTFLWLKRLVFKKMSGSWRFHSSKQKLCIFSYNKQLQKIFLSTILCFHTGCTGTLNCVFLPSHQKHLVIQPLWIMELHYILNSYN